MVERISTSGSLSYTRFQIQQQNERFGELQYQISTGRKYADLKDYGSNASRILDLGHEIDAREAYQRSINLTELTANAYDSSLERVVETLQQLMNAADPISPDDANWADDNAILADNLLLDLQSNLNVEIGGRYIYGGTNFTEAPVVDMRNLSTYTTNDIGVANTLETADQIPEHIIDSGGTNTVESYMANFAGTGTIDTKAWEEAQVTISNDQTISYGITAADPAFQNAVDAIMRFKAATQPGLTTDQRNSFLNEARTLADSTRTEVRHLQSRNGTFLNELENARSLHDSFITISKIALDKITVADTATAATEMSALQTMMQASFTVISRKSQLTLVQFL
ncbi:flagellin [Curvivirga sp.]|uniref:flagellin n=1 Tax=Curvivirga sp. TaxID=2856848 RepID=UPI003B5B741E